MDLTFYPAIVMLNEPNPNQMENRIKKGALTGALPPALGLMTTLGAIG